MRCGSTPNTHEMYVSAGPAGEAGGVLERTLEIAAKQFDQRLSFKRKSTAFVYPMVCLSRLSRRVFHADLHRAVFAKVSISSTAPCSG